MILSFPLFISHLFTYIRDNLNSTRSNSNNNSKYDSIELLLHIKKNSNLLKTREKTIFDKILDNLSKNAGKEENLNEKKEREKTFRSKIYKEELQKAKSPKANISKFKTNPLFAEKKKMPELVSPRNFYVAQMKEVRKKIEDEDSFITEEIKPFNGGSKKKEGIKKMQSIIPQNVKVKGFKGDVAKKFLVMSHEKFIY